MSDRRDENRAEYAGKPCDQSYATHTKKNKHTPVIAGLLNL